MVLSDHSLWTTQHATSLAQSWLDIKHWNQQSTCHLKVNQVQQLEIRRWKVFHLHPLCSAAPVQSHLKCCRHHHLAQHLEGLYLFVTLNHSILYSMCQRSVTVFVFMTFYFLVHKRKPAETLKVLYGMLDEAKTSEDIFAVKLRIQQTLYDIEQEVGWKKHLTGEGKWWGQQSWWKGDCVAKPEFQDIISQVIQIRSWHLMLRIFHFHVYIIHSTF